MSKCYQYQFVQIFQLVKEKIYIIGYIAWTYKKNTNSSIVETILKTHKLNIMISLPNPADICFLAAS